MAKAHLEALKMATAQRDAQHRATLDHLLQKKPREKVVEVELPREDGTMEKVGLQFRAIGSTAYDALVTRYPPTARQRKDGAAFDIDRFAPALISEVCIDPKMTMEEASDIWNSDAWNRGELFSLYHEAISLCVTGANLDPTESDSA